MAAGEVCDGGDVDDFEEGVTGGFDPDGFGIWAEGGGDEVEFGHVDEGELDAFFLKEAVEESECTTVEVGWGDDMVAGGKQCHGAVDGGHTGGGGNATGAAFECGDIFFECLARGVAGAGVVVTGVGFEGVPVEGGGGVDGRGDAVVLLIFVDSAVYAACFEAEIFWGFGGHLLGTAGVGTGLGGCG